MICIIPAINYLGLRGILARQGCCLYFLNDLWTSLGFLSSAVMSKLSTLPLHVKTKIYVSDALFSVSLPLLATSFSLVKQIL